MEFYAIGKRYEANTFWDFKGWEMLSYITDGCLLPDEQLAVEILDKYFDENEYVVVKITAVAKEGKMIFKVERNEDW